MLQLQEGELRDDGSGQTDEDDRAKGTIAVDEHAVDEDAHECGDEQTRHDERESAEQREGDGAASAAQMTPQRADEHLAAWFANECVGRLDGDRHAGVRPVEIVAIDDATAARGIVKVNAALRESLDDEKMIEAPKDDEGRRHLREIRDVAPIARGFQAVRTRDAHDVARRAAVAAHPARDA